MTETENPLRPDLPEFKAEAEGKAAIGKPMQPHRVDARIARRSGRGEAEIGA